MVRHYFQEPQSMDRLERLQEFVTDLLEREAEGVECEHETRETDSGIAVCTEPGCAAQFVDRALQQDWHTATQEWNILKGQARGLS